METSFKNLVTPSKLSFAESDYFGYRPEPVVPDGVWIEIQGNPSENEAVFNAIHEEKRISSVHQLKNKQLKKFQQDVQKRVVHATQAHRKFIINSQSAKMEKERELLCQSASAASLSTPKKNLCLYNVNQCSVIYGSGKLNDTDRFLSVSNQNLGDPMLHICSAASTNKDSKDVRKKLACHTILPKKIDLENDCNDLPGGVWGVGPSRDKCAARICEKRNQLFNDVSPSKELDLNLQTVSATSASDDVTLASVQESIASSLITSQKRLNELNKSGRIQEENDLKESARSQLEAVRLKANVHFELDDQQATLTDAPVLVTAEQINQHDSNHLVTRSAPKLTQSETHHRDLTECRSLRFSNAMGDLTNGVLAAPPLVKPGAFAHNLKLADKRAKWLSRRVFSDAERERSRELAKLKHHQQRVARLREEKERERAEIEEKSREQVEAIERANELMKKEAEDREKREMERKKEIAKKQQKTDRYITALHTQLRKRISQNNVQLPPLCMCANTFWDTNPNTCANNCLFYRNFKAYAKALEAVLKIVERNVVSVHQDLLQRSTVSVGFVDEDFVCSEPDSARSFNFSTARSSNLSVASINTSV